MKTLIAALAGAALLTTPIAAQAQHSGGHGGGGHSGGGFHGGGFHGGGFHGGGFRGGGFRGGGFRGGFHRGFFGDPFFFGAGLGLGYYYADPWFWGYPGYGYYGYPAYYGYPSYDYGDDDSYAAGGGYSGGASGYYRGSMPDDDSPGAQGPNDRVAAPPSSNAPAQACGSWRWDSASQKYQWDGC